MAENEQGTIDALRAEVNKLTGQIESMVKSFKGDKEERAADLAEKLARELENLRAGASDRAKQIYAAGATGVKEVGDQVRENPLLSLAIAFGAGCVISCLFRNLTK